VEEDSDSLCYRCKKKNRHHFVQRHKCVRSLCRLCRKLAESNHSSQALKLETELQQDRELTQKSMFEDARARALEDLNNT